MSNRTRATQSGGEPVPDTAMPPLVTGFRTLFRWLRTGTGWAVLLSIFGAAAIPLGTLGWLSYNGFCFAQGRFLPDTAYFDAAFERINRRSTFTRRVHESDRVVYTSVPVIPYRDKEEFYADNPGCCKIVPHNSGDDGPNVSFSQRIFGKSAKYISLEYKINTVMHWGCSNH